MHRRIQTTDAHHGGARHGKAKRASQGAHGDADRELRVCWGFQAGSCRRGARCRFLHEVSDEAEVPEQDRSDSEEKPFSPDGGDTPSGAPQGQTAKVASAPAASQSSASGKSEKDKPGKRTNKVEPKWNFSVTPKETAVLEAAGIRGCGDPNRLPSTLPVGVMVFVQRVCREYALDWDLNPFGAAPLEEGHGRLSCSSEQQGPEFTHLFGCSEVRDVFCFEGMVGVPTLHGVSVRSCGREFLIPYVTGHVWARYGPFVVVGPSDGAPQGGFEQPSYLPLFKAGDEGRTLWQSGRHSSWQFPEMEILSWGDRLFTRTTGRSIIYCVPESYVGRAKWYFTTKPLRTPDNFRACVLSVSAYAQTSVSTGQALDVEPSLVVAAVVLAYMDVEESASVLAGAFSHDFQDFNDLVMGKRVVHINWRLLITTLCVVTGIALGFAYTFGPVWAGHSAVAVTGTLWVLVLLWSLRFHRGKSGLWASPAPGIVEAARRQLVYAPCQEGDSYPIGARVYSCRSAGHIVVGGRDAAFKPNQLDAVVRVAEGADLLTATRTSVHLVRVGCTSDTVPTVHCPQPRTVFAALARFLNDYDPPEEAPPGLDAHFNAVRYNWSPEFKELVGRLQFKPDRSIVDQWWEVYKKHPNASRLRYVWDTLFKEIDGVVPYEAYDENDPHITETEFFGKLEVASRMRGIESVHPFLLVILGVADFLLRPALYRMYRSLTAQPMWQHRLFWAPGCSREELAAWGWSFRHACIVYWDFSRWDGSVPVWLMTKFYAMFENDSDSWNRLLQRLTRRKLRLRFNRKAFVFVDFSGKVMSGSPWTTFMNTFLHWITMTFAFASLGWLEAMQSMILGGDDGSCAFPFEFTQEHARLLQTFMMSAFGFKLDPIGFGQVTSADFFSSRWVPALGPTGECFAFVPKCGRALQKLGWAIDVQPGKELETYLAKLLSLRHDSEGCPLCAPLLSRWVEDAKFVGVLPARLKREEYRPTPDSRQLKPAGLATWQTWYPGASMSDILACGPFDNIHVDHLARVDYGKDSFMGSDSPNTEKGTHFPVTVDLDRTDRAQLSQDVDWLALARALPLRPAVGYVSPVVEVWVDLSRYGAVGVHAASAITAVGAALRRVRR